MWLRDALEDLPLCDRIKFRSNCLFPWLGLLEKLSFLDLGNFSFFEVIGSMFRLAFLSNLVPNFTLVFVLDFLVFLTDFWAVSKCCFCKNSLEDLLC